MNSYDTIIKNIQLFMYQQGIKQCMVAQKCGFNEQEFSNMLNKRKIIRAEYLPIIARTLGVTPNDLCGITNINHEAS